MLSHSRFLVLQNEAFAIGFVISATLLIWIASTIDVFLVTQ